MGRPVSLKAGTAVGEWTLLEYFPGQQSPRREARWRCRCSCGTETTVRAHNLSIGSSLSCGHASRAKAGLENLAWLKTFFGPMKPKPPKCKHCGREQLDHRAKTYQCPAKGRNTRFLDTVFEVLR